MTFHQPQIIALTMKCRNWECLGALIDGCACQFEVSPMHAIVIHFARTMEILSASFCSGVYSSYTTPDRSLRASCMSSSF